jgi:hypothetical protein
MKPVKSLLASIVVALLIQSLVFGASATIQPRLKLTVGQKFKLKAGSDAKMTQTVNGEKQTILDSASIMFAFEVQNVDETGDMTIKATYDSIRLTEDAPAGKVSFDSASTAEAPPLTRGIAALVGQSFIMRITPDGRVRSVTGADEIVAKAIEKHNVLSEPWKSSMSRIIQDRFGDLQTSENMQGLFGIYPEKAVAVGERWSRKIEMIGNIAECFFKITDRKAGVLTIKAYATIAPNPDAPPIQMGLAQVKSEATGTQEGTFRIDEATGMILNLKETNKSSGNLVVITGGPEVRIPTSVTGSTTIDKL